MHVLPHDKYCSESSDSIEHWSHYLTLLHIVPTYWSFVKISQCILFERQKSNRSWKIQTPYFGVKNGQNSILGFRNCISMSRNLDMWIYKAETFTESLVTSAKTKMNSVSRKPNTEHGCHKGCTVWHSILYCIVFSFIAKSI